MKRALLAYAWSLAAMSISAFAGCASQDHAGSAPAGADAHVFRWVDQPDGTTDLYDSNRRVLCYVHAYDPSTDETLHETYKVYHHVFDENGEKLITKGSGGLYTHHRGIFIGWNKLTLGGNEYDYWHMKGVTQRHVETLELAAGDGDARQIARIDWCGPDGKAALIERRSISVREVARPGFLLLDFESQITPIAGDVLLDGDPEHAGFQFRAHNDVADGGPEVKAAYLFHEEGIDPTRDKDLPWVAMGFELNGKRYTVLHMNHPANPRGTVYSAYRDYGRFGAFPRVEIRKDETLTLRYRIYVMLGDMPAREQMERRYQDYIRAR
ncbi:MAG: PmoA family protein [Phycisphaerales bacterium]|nr:MAG: PmoA family protein [Phycisphaerales bacterium]